MDSLSTAKSSVQQKGIVLIILLVIIALSLISFTVSQLSVTDIVVQRKVDTRKALKMAKQALIAYAVNYEKTSPTIRGPGYFLCPDTNNDGLGETSCNGESTVGRLPWQTLGIGDIRDSSNERLWYAVSENFDYTASPDTPGSVPTRKVINTGTRGNITVRDNEGLIIYNGTGIDAAVAVIVAPGLVLTRDDGTVQSRTIANENNAIHYLDIDSSGEDNADFDQGDMPGVNDDGFVQGLIVNASGNIIVNDIIEVITYSDIMDEVHKRVSVEMSNLINNYFTNCAAYPEASAFNPTKILFDSAGLAITPGLELREGHLPLDSALPIDWGVACPSTLIPATTIAPTPVAWLAAEEWHKVSYYEFAYTNPGFPTPATAGTVCIPADPDPDLDCLVVNSSNDISALIVFSGRDLTSSRPFNNMSRYFEGENITTNSVYSADEPDDYVRIVAP